MHFGKCQCLKYFRKCKPTIKRKLKFTTLLILFLYNLFCPILAIVTNMPRSIEAKQQMIKECKRCYWDKPRQLAEVIEFQRFYTQEQAVRWYTRPCFIHRLINKALRTEDIVTLWTFRYFISDLSMKLTHMRMKIVEPLVLYRGTIMAHSQIQLLSVGSLVSANGFFSTTRSRAVAEMFIATGICQNNQNQFVLFEINILPNSSDAIFADVATESHVPEEAEVLFDLGTIFEVVHLWQDVDTFVGHIVLSPSHKSQDIKQDYERFILSQMEYTNPSVLFGILFADMGEYTKSLTFFQNQLRTLPPRNKDLPNVYYGLARTYRFLGRYQLALALMRRAERLQRQMQPLVSFDYARTLASLATVHAVMGNFARELHYYKRAYALYQNILPTQQHVEIARSLSRLGLAYIHLKRYVRASSVLRHSLKIYHETTPKNHEYKAEAIELLGIAYDGLGDIDRSFKLIQEALSMRRACLRRDHPRIEHNYLVLVDIYQKNEKYQLALEYAEKLLKFREQNLPHDSKSIEEAQNLLERLHIYADKMQKTLE